MGKGARNRAMRKENQPTREQTRQLNEMIRKEVSKNLVTATDTFYNSECAVLLWILYDEFGFRKERLQKFLNTYRPYCDELKEYFCMADSDVPFICEQKLKDHGIDIEELQKVAYEKITQK